MTRKKLSSLFSVMLAVLMIFSSLPSTELSASADSIKINLVEFTAAIPYPERSPNINVTVKGTGYSVDTSYNDSSRYNGVTWIDNTENKVVNPNSSKFIEGHEYSISIRIILVSVKI